MTVYSYNAKQLKKKGVPNKKFWTSNKIKVTIVSGSLVLFGTIVANISSTTAVTTTPTEVQAQQTSVVSNKPPVEGAKWSNTYQSWLCPTTPPDPYGRVNSYEQCTATNYPTAAEQNQTKQFQACVGRSGKEEHTMGWSWAAAQCRENTNAF
jgi:hypothetical protein